MRSTIRELVAIGEPAGELVEITGAAVDPEDVQGRAVTVIEHGEPPLVMVHDPALEDDPPLFSAIGNAVAVPRPDPAARPRARSARRRARGSRARGAGPRHRAPPHRTRPARRRAAAAGGHARASGARARPGAGRLGGSAGLDVFDAELTDGISELRNLARGVYPPVLQSDGLSEALGAAARQAPLPAGVTATEVGGYSAALEAAVYFSCLEALQNASKHAGSGARVDIRLRESDGTLHASVHDDGCGFSTLRPCNCPAGFSTSATGSNRSAESSRSHRHPAGAPPCSSAPCPPERAGSAGPGANLT